MLCEISKGTSTELKNYLVHEHGMLIRDCQNFDGLSNRLFRVTTQLPDENDSLVAAIKQYISGINKE
jgi:threonine-phosphate decarboxylase